VISGFRREVHENCDFLGYYVASSGNFLQTFRDNILVPSSREEMIPIVCSAASVRNEHYSMRNNPEEPSSYLVSSLSISSIPSFP
jgi:hypothetical protein